MDKVLKAVLVVAGMTILGIPASANGKEENRVWVVWEQSKVNPELCKAKNLCRPLSEYTSRLLERPTTKSAAKVMKSLDKLAKKRGEPVEHPKAPRMCQSVDAQKILGFEAESWPMSEKMDALRGLQGVFFRFDGLKSPEGFDGPFGPAVQVAAEQKFEKAGIRVLSDEELEKTPGRPHLNIYFSNTNPDTGCWFSVFASLTQTILLTRNHTVKLKAGTWGFSGGYSADNPDRSEFDAIMLVVDRFIDDFTKANAPQKGKGKGKKSKKTAQKG